MWQYGNLWLHIFAHMETLTSDPRPEVRNCAVRTLFSTLSTHGGVLVPDTWQALIFGVRGSRMTVCVVTVTVTVRAQILFPVLDVAHLGPKRDAVPERMSPLVYAGAVLSCPGPPLIGRHACTA
jgi:hypothetical protein